MLSEAKGRQIMQAALNTFLQHGYKGTSMDRVAREAGVSKQTVYSHYRDKKGLFTALVAHLSEKLFPPELLTVPAEAEPGALLRTMARAYVDALGTWEHTAFNRLVLAESPRFPELGEIYLRKAVEPGLNMIVAYLQQHRELAISDPEATARAFFSALSSFAIGRELLQEKYLMPMDTDRLIKVLVHMITKL
ncbi:MAG TPA: TetR/AcrR family transcriptional regulator [Candidatus Obscuribacterales bacterium]